MQGFSASARLTRRNDLTMVSQWKQHLKNYFVAGLLVVIPLATTIWLTVEVAAWSVGILTSIPKQFNPIQGLHPILINLIDLAVGLLTPVLLILLIGFMARNIVGQWLLNLSEQLLHAIPVAGLVYKTLKQLLSVLFAPNNQGFRRVVLVEYPRPGAWALAFVTGTIQTPIRPGGPQRSLSLFVPTTPNPTTGWYAIVPEDQVVEVFMPVEDAFKMLISGGIVTPESFEAGLQRREGALAVTMPSLRELVEQERVAGSPRADSVGSEVGFETEGIP
ncbi:MAG TPA: DUF502 domain-containing protein [Synechococcus sp. M44_DOE_062]|nr:DUF502 domain-containing protein [Synechococcus sp. M44_DOE_062]